MEERVKKYFNLSSVNLDQSKILLFGKELQQRLPMAAPCMGSEFYLIYISLLLLKVLGQIVTFAELFVVFRI